MSTKSPLQRAVDIAGGQSALGSMINRAQGHVYYWLYRAKNGCPPNVAIEIEAALDGQITRYDLRPDIFGRKPEEAA